MSRNWTYYRDVNVVYEEDTGYLTILSKHDADEQLGRFYVLEED